MVRVDHQPAGDADRLGGIEPGRKLWFGPVWMCFEETRRPFDNDRAFFGITDICNESEVRIYIAHLIKVAVGSLAAAAILWFYCNDVANDADRDAFERFDHGQLAGDPIFAMRLGKIAVVTPRIWEFEDRLPRNI